MRIYIVLSLVGVLSGCVATSQGSNVSGPDQRNGQINAQAGAQINAPKGVELTSDFSRSKLIAADFVATIAQIPATDPTTTVLHTDKPSTRFGELLLGSLQKAGFDLRVGSESSDVWLAYNAIRDEQASEEGNPVYTFIVSAGEVKLKRSYEVDQYGVRPTGGMFVRGASINNVVSDDSMFGIGKPKPLTVPTPTIADLNSDGVSIAAIPTAKPFVKSAKVFTPEEMQKLEQRRELEESVAALSLLNDAASLNEFNSSDAYAEVPNMAVNMQSRYQDIFDNYEVLNTSILVFPDDSLLLGRDNKQVLRRYANDFNAQTDVMSVIGCSHGKSKLANGNAYLANNRAFRVKEEFIAIGLEPKTVLEEGCWADSAYGDMPARGVLVQHKRLANQ